MILDRIYKILIFLSSYIIGYLIIDYIIEQLSSDHEFIFRTVIMMILIYIVAYPIGKFVTGFILSRRA